MRQANIWITTEHPAIVFEDTEVGRLKKKIWDASEEDIATILGDFGIPSSPELGKPGSYIQTTVRAKVIENRRKKRRCFDPHWLYRKPWSAHDLWLRHIYGDPDMRSGASLYRKARSPGSSCTSSSQLRGPSLPPHWHAWNSDCARTCGARNSDRGDARALE